MASEFLLEDIPCGMIQFHSDFQYAEACSFCSDFDMDVLELFLNGYNWLVFFTSGELNACVFFLDIHNIDYTLFVKA